MAKRSDLLGVTGVDTVIGSGVKVKGNLVSDGDVVIDAVMGGNIKANGNVTIGFNARVTGDVIGHNVTIAGHLTGNITAREETFIAETGEVTGDISTGLISISSGAVFIGTSKMKRPAASEIPSTPEKPLNITEQ
jgi:cytoskeletal protein CcmA (bactofilin family)